MRIEDENAAYLPCSRCEGDGCIDPNPAEDQCERCGGTGCEPFYVRPGDVLAYDRITVAEARRRGLVDGAVCLGDGCEGRASWWHEGERVFWFAPVKPRRNEAPASQRMEPGDPRAKAIEAMARRLKESFGYDVQETYRPAFWTDLARAALAALEQEGLVLTDTREAENDGRQVAIDRALSALRGTAYVGGPTMDEAWRTAVDALGRFATEHRGVPVEEESDA